MRPLQCKTCGLRFAETQREELREHMDGHFRKNLAKSGKPGAAAIAVKRSIAMGSTQPWL